MLSTIKEAIKNIFNTNAEGLERKYSNKLNQYIMSNKQEKANYLLTQLKINKTNITPIMLEQSIKYGNEIAVRKIISGLKINNVTFKANSRYETAILKGLFDCIVGVNSLIDESKKNDLKIAIYLFTEIIDIDNANEEPLYKLFEFIMKLENISLMEYMVRYNKFIDYILSNKELIPLHKAAENGNVHLFKSLVIKGADLSHKDKNGYTPLIYASYYNITDIIDLMFNYFNYKPTEDEETQILHNAYVYTLNKIKSKELSNQIQISEIN